MNPQEKIKRSFLKSLVKFTDVSFILDFLQSILSLTALIFIAITTIDFLVNDDLFSQDKVINSEEVQFELRIQETKFRERLLNEISKSSLESNFNILDSNTINIKNTDEIKKALVLNELKSNIRNYNFAIKVDRSTSPLVKMKDLKVSFKIDFERLNNIIMSSNFKIIYDNLKYGNFIETKYSLDKKIKIDYVIIFILAYLSIILINYFYQGKTPKSKEGTLDKDIKDLKSEKEFLDKEKEHLKSENPERIEEFESKIIALESKLKDHDLEKILRSILYQDVVKSEMRSIELYNRSTLMLFLGLLVAIAGIIIFYFTLPNFSEIKNNSDYIALAIRPTLILFFIQSISFYLLRQYRTLINDYKYFHDEFLRKSNVFTAYQLLKNNDLNDDNLKIIDSLLNSKSEPKHPVTEEKEENPNDKIIDLIKTALDKIKK